MLAALWCSGPSPDRRSPSVFAALGPVIALATLADSRWSARRTRRSAAIAFDEELAAPRTRIRAAHTAERAVLDELHPAGLGARAPARGRPGSMADGMRLNWCSGGTTIPSAVLLDPGARADEPYRSRLVELADEAAALRDAPITVPVTTGIGVCGPRPLAQAVLRALAVQLAWSLSPGQWWFGETGEGWANALPHPRGPAPPSQGIRLGRSDADGTVTLALADREDDLPAGCGAVLVVGGGELARIAWHPDPALRGELTIDAVSERDAAEWAAALRSEAVRTGLLGTAATLPRSIGLHELPTEGALADGGLAAQFAVTAAGPLTIDLVEHGPHAIVGGTTGSGKSELLVAWVVALAARYPPSALGFLLVDFKGGSAFAALAALPHATGTITDLDAGGALRALASLRAEVTAPGAGARRGSGARDITEAMDVSGRPCSDGWSSWSTSSPRCSPSTPTCTRCSPTSPPAGAPWASTSCCARSDRRARCATRCWPTPTSGSRCGSTIAPTAPPSIGTDDAAAILRRGAAGAHSSRWRAGDPVLVQFARASDADLAGGRAALGGFEPTARRPWIEPLPERGPDSPSSRLAPDGYPFGLLDRPDEQRREVAVWAPSRHGGLLVLGCGRRRHEHRARHDRGVRSGARWLPRACRSGLGCGPDLLGAPAPGVVAADDLDALFGRFLQTIAREFADRLVRLAQRRVLSSGLHVVASMRRIPGELQVLREPAAQPSAAAAREPARPRARRRRRRAPRSVGGPGRRHLAECAGPGRHWVPGGGPRIRRRADEHRSPRARRSRWSRREPLPWRSGWPKRATASIAWPRRSLPDSDAPFAVIGDVDEWQAHWGALAALRPLAATVFDACSPSDLRQLTRNRQLPPPLGERSVHGWWAATATSARTALPERSPPARRPAGRSRPCATATGSLATLPAYVLSPRASAGSAPRAASQPRFVIARTYGSVAFVSA